MAQELAPPHQPDENIRQQAQLIALVLDGVTSDHSRRSSRTGLVACCWIVIAHCSCCSDPATLHAWEAAGKEAAVPASKATPANVAATKATYQAKKAVAKKAPTRKSAEKEAPVRQALHSAAAAPAKSTAPETSVVEAPAEA